MQRNFIQTTEATHYGIDAEDVQAIVEFDHACEQEWPIWVLFKAGQPVAWYDESAEVAGFAR